MKKKPFAILGVTVCALMLGACGSGAGTKGSSTQVVAAFYPFAFVAAEVGGTNVAVDNLTSPGVEPHDLELKPKQVGSVQNADLVLFEKHFQAAVDEAVDQAGRNDKDTVDVAELVRLQPLPAGTDEDGADEKHGHDEDDPHVWLDPVNMIAVTEAVRAKLSAIDPDHAASYDKNAAALTAKLKDLDKSFSAGLARCQTSKIVTSHAAFGYLAKRYGLEQVAIAGIDPSNEPSPAQLADITKLVRKNKITTIFTEELVSPAIASTVAQETGAKTATLDPIEGLSDETADENYLTLMAKNLAVIEKANNCS
ncbi:MAG: metal ABC transporter substrate-binding protein [Actinomycetota bacterium]|nr:metal ABC transporter substrate-binding protein [Actinomycetota bacterium]